MQKQIGTQLMCTNSNKKSFRFYHVRYKCTWRKQNALLLLHLTTRLYWKYTKIKKGG